MKKFKGRRSTKRLVISFFSVSCRSILFKVLPTVDKQAFHSRARRTISVSEGEWDSLFARVRADLWLTRTT